MISLKNVEKHRNTQRDNTGCYMNPLGSGLYSPQPRRGGRDRDRLGRREGERGVRRELPRGDCFADSTPLGFNTSRIPPWRRVLNPSGVESAKQSQRGSSVRRWRERGEGSGE